MWARDGAGPGLSSRAIISAVFFANGALFASWVSRIPSVKDAAGLTEADVKRAIREVRAKK